MGRIIRTTHVSWQGDGAEPDAPGPVQGATLPWFFVEDLGSHAEVTLHAGRGMWSGGFTLSDGVLRHSDTIYQPDDYLSLSVGSSEVGIPLDLFEALAQSAAADTSRAQSYFSYQSGEAGDAGQVLVTQVGSARLLVASIAGRGGLSVFEYPQNAQEATRRDTINDTAALFIGDPVGLVSAEHGGATYIYAASSGDEAGISAFRLGSSGQLNHVGSLRVEDGLWVDSITRLDAVEAGGQTYLLVAAAGSGSLSVVRIGEAGAMNVVDHMLDDLNTRFANIAVIETLAVGDRTYIAVSGGDDGVSLLGLLPNGQLLHYETVADTEELGLGSISALSLSEQDGRIHLIASSESEPGLTHIVYDPGEGVQRAGTGGNDTISGSGGEDILLDGAGSDQLTGGAGADLFIMAEDGQMDRIMDFQVGLDRVDLSAWTGLYSTLQIAVVSRSDGAEVRYGDERLILRSHDGARLEFEDFLATDILGIARLIPIEDRPQNLSERDGTEVGDLLEGSDDDNTLNGLAGDDRILGLGGNDSLIGGAGSDTLIADVGNDTLRGDSGHDDLDGGTGRDVLYGGTGADTLAGGDGNDQLWGDSSTDLLYGGAGQDTLTGGTGADTLYGGDGHDRILSNTGVDLVYGGAGNDWISPGNGIDIAFGEGGNDTIIGRTGWDTLDGGSGDDALYGSEGRAALQGGAGNDYLSGGFGYDTLWGGAGNDALYGNIGRDELLGGDGNDALFGATGDDLLRGGDGDDELFGAQGRDTLEGGSGNDLLRGGTLVDTFLFDLGHGRDTISGLERQDEVYLATAVTQGLTDAEEIVDRFARVVDGDVVLWFAHGDKIFFEDGVSEADLIDVLHVF